jgi:hypothetical protein
MFNLYESIVSHDFIDQLDSKTHYTILTDDRVWIDTDMVRRHSFSDILMTKDIPEIRGNLICIARYLTSKDILLLNEIIQHPCTWISLNPWLTSIISKKMPEENDIIVSLHQWYKVIEPISNGDMIKALWTKSYLRIYDKPLPSKTSKLARDNGIAYLSGSQRQSYFTVLSTLSCIDEVAGAIHNTSKWSENIFELYVWSEISTRLNSEIIESIRKTQHIIIIIDHKATEELRLFCDTLVKEHCGHQITIQYIFPQFHLVSSILSDYIFEEARFDQLSIEDYFADSIEQYNRRANSE